MKTICDICGNKIKFISGQGLSYLNRNKDGIIVIACRDCEKDSKKIWMYEIKEDNPHKP